MTDPNAHGPVNGLVDCEADGGDHRWRDRFRAHDGRIAEQCRDCGSARTRPPSRHRYAVVVIDLDTGEPHLSKVFTADDDPDGDDPAHLAHVYADDLTTRDHDAVVQRLSLAPITDPTP